MANDNSTETNPVLKDLWGAASTADDIHSDLKVVANMIRDNMESESDNAPDQLSMLIKLLDSISDEAHKLADDIYSLHNTSKLQEV